MSRGYLLIVFELSHILIAKAIKKTANAAEWRILLWKEQSVQ